MVSDTSPENTYRRSVYASTTGGGSGGTPLFFATDVNEQRRQRALFGSFLNQIGLVKPEDWVLTLHSSGRLYRSVEHQFEHGGKRWQRRKKTEMKADSLSRSLDLTLEILENAQASVLSAGSFMSPGEVVELLAQFSVNVLTGDGGQIVEVVHYISTLPEAERARLRLDKVIYTSEALTSSQRGHIRLILGVHVEICSILGSGEAGPYAASLGYMVDDGSYTDFIYNSRAMLIEIFPLSCLDDQTEEVATPPSTLQDGEPGLVAQTSLTRLRNPLVRYMTGDVGSILPAPERALAAVPEADRPYLRVLRLHGRDRRFSFSWSGEYYDFAKLTKLMNDESSGVLQWQVILDKMEASTEAFLKVRLLLGPRRNDVRLQDRSNGVKHVDGDHEPYRESDIEPDIFEKVRKFFMVDMTTDRRFQIVEVPGLEGFERSSTGKKVIKFIDRFTD